MRHDSSTFPIIREEKGNVHLSSSPRVSLLSSPVPMCTNPPCRCDFNAGVWASVLLPLSLTHVVCTPWLFKKKQNIYIYIFIFIFWNCITPWLLLELFCLQDCEWDGQWTPPQDFYPGKQRGGISSYLGRVGLSLGCPHHLFPWNKLERMLSIPPQVV